MKLAAVVGWVLYLIVVSGLWVESDRLANVVTKLPSMAQSEDEVDHLIRRDSANPYLQAQRAVSMEFLKAAEQRDFNKQMREKATRVSENALWITIYGGIGWQF